MRLSVSMENHKQIEMKTMVAQWLIVGNEGANKYCMSALLVGILVLGL